jgi:CubicO group peptidase (beta-lactamase class C family)
MKGCKRSLFLMFVICQINFEAAGQEVTETLYNYLSSAAYAGDINGNVLVVRHGQIVHKASFGYRDVGTKAPNTDSTLFQLASISKIFTAVCVLQLAEKGKLQLDAPYAKYIPSFPYNNITIRHLLSHTSGLPDKEQLLDSLIAKNPQHIYTPADIIPALQIFKSGKQLIFQPGDRWGYSSIGYSLLALLVEKISKQSFVSYCRQYIFIPAGMKSTYVQTSINEAKRPNEVIGYQYNNRFEMKLQQMDTLPDWKEWTYNLTGLIGGNNVISTALDLSRFDQALNSNVLLKPSTLEEAYTPVKLNSGENNKAASGSSCGLGWFIFDTPQGKIVWHSGSNPGISTLFARNLKKTECYIVLQNIPSPGAVYFATLDIIKGFQKVYRRSVAFAYARDFYTKGADYALARLYQLQADTANYTLTEAELERVALEYSRTKNLQHQCLETYKIVTLLFPQSWTALNNYANAVWKKTGDKETAIMLYQKALLLNNDNAQAKNALKMLQ